MTTPSLPELKPLKVETGLQVQDPPVISSHAKTIIRGEVPHPRASVWPSIETDDGVALNRFLVFLATHKNAFACSEYISNFDQPGNIQKLVLKLPYNVRERWRRLADDIMDRQSRSVQCSDFVAFVDRKARILTNSVFDKISVRSPSYIQFGLERVD